MPETVGDCSTCGMPRLPDGTCPVCKHDVLRDEPDQHPGNGSSDDVVAGFVQESNWKRELGEGLVILGGYAVIITGYVWIAKTTESLFVLGVKLTLWMLFMHVVMGVLMVFVALVTMQPGERE